MAADSQNLMHWVPKIDEAENFTEISKKLAS